MDISWRAYRALATATVLLALAVMIYTMKDLMIAILFSSLLAFLLRPVYLRLARKTGMTRASSIASITLIFLIISLVFFRVVIVLFSELSSMTEYGGEAYTHVLRFSATIDAAARSYLPAPAADYLASISTEVLSWILSTLEGGLASFGRDLPLLITEFILAIFFTYYLLIDGGAFIDEIISFLPDSLFLHRFLEELKGIYYTLFNVYFLSSIITGIIASIGFYLIGLSYPLIWGSVTAIFSIIPMLGPILVYVPISVYYLVTGDVTRAAAVLIFGALVLSILTDDVLRPQLARMGGASVHPMITLIAFTAPVLTFGVVGAIIGPALYGLVLAAYRTAKDIRDTP